MSQAVDDAIKMALLEVAFATKLEPLGECELARHRRLAMLKEAGRLLRQLEQSLQPAQAASHLFQEGAELRQQQLQAVIH